MSSTHLEENLSILPWNKTRLALTKLQDLLRCNKCQQLPSSPQYMGRCDHFFCQACIKDITQSFCPICKIPSAPCDRKPDIIVESLVSSVSEMFTLIHGGEVKSTRGLEAPESSMMLPSAGVSTAAANCTSSKASVLRSSTSAENQSTNKVNVKDTSNIPSCGNAVKTKERLSRLPKKVAPKSKETNLVKNKSKICITNYLEKKENTPVSCTKSKAESGYSDISAKRVEQHYMPVSAGGTPTTPAVNKRNVKGETTLHIACIKKDVQTVKKLLVEGANPNTKDNAGWTPLHEACSNGFEEIASLLLEHGAIVDVPGSNNMTPLHDAVLTESFPVIRLLRKWGASDISRDILGRTPRSIAAYTKSSELILEALSTSNDALLVPKAILGPMTYKIVIVDTGLTNDQKKKLESVAKLIKAKLVKDFSNEVTHIIVRCEEDKVCQRTIKYMMGVVSGKWIVSHKWLDACLSIGGPANPLEYEVEGPRNNPCCQAPSKGRVNASKMLPGLFSGCHIYFHGLFGGGLPSKKELEALVKAGDCVPLYREPNPESIGDAEQTVPYHTTPDGPLAKCSHYCIYAEGPNEPQMKYDMAHIKSFPLSWLYQCIDDWVLSTIQKLLQ